MAPTRFEFSPLAATALLCALFCLVFSSRAGAADSAALLLLRDIKATQAKNGLLAAQQVPQLLELGRIYSGGQCEHAIDILDLALQLSRRNEGLFNTAQLDIYEPLLSCYMTLQRPDALQEAQRYIVMIGEQSYGPQDLRLLPTLEQGARRFEEAGLYLSARKLHRRAIDIVRRVAGENDLGLVKPLRGMARAFRLEYEYGLALPDLVELATDTSNLRSRAIFDQRTGTRLDGLGQRSLEQAVAILRRHEQADRRERASALLELGDWYQIDGSRREALRTYRELWNEGHTEVLSSAQLLLARLEKSMPLRRPPADADDRRKYTIDLQYTVSRDGRARDVEVFESDAPASYGRQAAQDLKRAHFRPRFADGEPVDTNGMHHRQNIYAKRGAN